MNTAATPARTTECANPNHEHGTRCINCGQPVHLDTTGPDVWAHDDAAAVCYTAPATQERNAPTYTECVPAEGPVQHPAIVCTEVRHDHTRYDEQLGDSVPGEAMRCADCDELMHYDRNIEDYVHDDPRAECFLAPAREVHTGRGATGCTAVVLDGTLYYGLSVKPGTSHVPTSHWVSVVDSDGERFTMRASRLVRSALQVQA